MLKTDKFLDYAVDGTVKVKDYDYTDPNHIIISENNKPVFVIDKYEDDDHPECSKIVYYKYIDGMGTKSRVKSNIILSKYIEKKEDHTVINTYDNNDNLVEYEKIVETDNYILNVRQRASDNTNIMRVIRGNEEIIKERSGDHIVNEYIRNMDNGNRIVVFVQQHIFNEESTFQYIRIEYENDEPVSVVQKLHDSKFKCIHSYRSNDKDEISLLPWLSRNTKILEDEEIFGNGELVARVYCDNMNNNKNIVYYTSDGDQLVDIYITKDTDIISYRIEYDGREYIVKRYIDISSSLYEVSFYKYKINDDIEQSISMLVPSNLIKNLLDEIIMDLFETLRIEYKE